MVGVSDGSAFIAIILLKKKCVFQISTQLKLDMRRHADVWSQPDHYPVHPPTPLWSHKSISWPWMDDSHPFRSSSIGHPIPEIKLFQILTLKLQGQGHGCGHRARSYNQPSIISTHFLFIHINQTNNSGDREISKFELETSKVKVMSEIKGQGHILYPVSNQCTSFPFHINRTNHMAKIVFELEKTHPKFLKKICQNYIFEQNFSNLIR